MTSEQRRVLIIGGGVGGLTAAIALRRAGRDVAVFERAPAHREVGAGLAVWTNALKALAPLGLAQDVAARGTAIETMVLRTAPGAELARVPIGAWCRGLGAPAVCLHRADLMAALLEGAAREGVAVSYGATLASIEPDDAGVTARFADGAVARGAVLVGADGIRSTVRRALHGDEPLAFAGRTSWRGVAHVDAPPFPLDTSAETFGRGRRTGMFHLPGGRVYWFAALNTPAPDAPFPGSQREAVLAQFAHFAAPVPAVIAATRDEDMVRTDLFDRPPRAPWGRGRVTLLGDAAHPMTPDLGQGACMAIEDAVVLARSLAASGGGDGAGEPAALRAYEATRHARTAPLVKRAARLGAMRQWENPVARWLRDGVLRVMPAAVALRQLAPAVAFEV